MPTMHLIAATFYEIAMPILILVCITVALFFVK